MLYEPSFNILRYALVFVNNYFNLEIEILCNFLNFMKVLCNFSNFNKLDFA